MKLILGLTVLGLISISALKIYEFARDFDKDFTFHLEDDLNGK